MVHEHRVDCGLYFEGDQHMTYRILRAAKNRFGATNEIGVFEMENDGLIEVENPSEMLLSGRPADAPGTCVTCVMEGARPVLAEIQALLASSSYPTPRRTSNGFDYNRATMLLAVLEKRVGFKLMQKDVFLNIAGGLRVTDMAMDLSVIAAVLSSNVDTPIESGWCMAGEVGLSGEVRPVSRIEARIAEAEKLGFQHIIIPKYNLQGFDHSKYTIAIHPVRMVEEALRLLFG